MAVDQKFFAVLAVFFGLAFCPERASCAPFHVLHTFVGGKDGYFPSYALTAGRDGNLYGVTYGSSGEAGRHCSKGCGNAYALSRGGRERIIFYFDSKHGAFPSSPLLLYRRQFYGTTGTINSNGQGGTVYRLTPHGTQTILYNFCSRANCADGSYPFGHLAVDSAGNLYGTTVEGGNIMPRCRVFGDIGCGTIFKLAADGSETVVYLFCSQQNCADGFLPQDGVVSDAAGNLYGTTSFGGARAKGTVFELSANGAYTVLYSFCSVKDCADGAQPVAGITLDGSGNLYGTAFRGGAGSCSGKPPGCGVVFKLTPGGTQTVLYSFKGGKGDGSLPETNLLFDAKGNLYGTTAFGGSRGKGTAYKLSADGTETILHSFCSETHCADGSIPQDLLLQGNHLFATATLGGSKTCDCGVAYRLTVK